MSGTVWEVPPSSLVRRPVTCYPSDANRMPASGNGDSGRPPPGSGRSLPGRRPDREPAAAPGRGSRQGLGHCMAGTRGSARQPGHRSTLSGDVCSPVAGQALLWGLLGLSFPPLWPLPCLLGVLSTLATVKIKK